MAFNPNPFSTEDCRSDQPQRHRTSSPSTVQSPPLASSRESSRSPAPDRLSALHHGIPGRGQSPCLPRKTIEELETGEHKRKEGTVDPDDPPLRSAWTFWFERAPVIGGSADEYAQALKNIYTVHTIKQFFSVYNNLKAPNLLRPKECYHLMRVCGQTNEHRKPLWEDPQNLNGGIWVFKCKKDLTIAVWLELLLAAIGEQFLDSCCEGDEVVGISIKVRDHDTDTIQVWNENASGHETSKVMERVRTIIPYLDVRDYFYSSIKDKLSGNRPPFHPSSSQHLQSHSRTDHSIPSSQVPSTTNPRSSFNPQFSSHQNRFTTPPRGSGGYKRGAEGYFRHQSPRHSTATSGQPRFPSGFNP